MKDVQSLLPTVKKNTARPTANPEGSFPMPRMKPKAEPSPPTVSAPPSVNGPADEVLTLAGAAAYLKLAESDVLRLVQEQGLPGRQLGKEWRFLKAAIQDWLRLGHASKSNKEAWMGLAGVWQDDPLVEDELKETYRRRGRPMTEDAS
jgi:excisionase family DNA binding protein